MRKRTLLVMALGAVLALLVGAQVAFATHGVATLTGSTDRTRAAVLAIELGFSAPDLGG